MEAFSPYFRRVAGDIIEPRQTGPFEGVGGDLLGLKSEATSLAESRIEDIEGHIAAKYGMRASELVSVYQTTLGGLAAGFAALVAALVKGGKDLGGNTAVAGVLIALSAVAAAWRWWQVRELQREFTGFVDLVKLVRKGLSWTP